jgi:hypothetical protein
MTDNDGAATSRLSSGIAGICTAGGTAILRRS